MPQQEEWEMNADNRSECELLLVLLAKAGCTGSPPLKNIYIIVDLLKAMLLLISGGSLFST